MGHVRQQPVQHLGAALGLPHLLGAHLLQPACEHDGLAAPVDIELAVDRRHVQLDRALGDVQPRGDLLVRQAVGGQRQDLDLLGGELPAAAGRFGFGAVGVGGRLGTGFVLGEGALAGEVRPVSGALQGEAQHRQHLALGVQARDVGHGAGSEHLVDAVCIGGAAQHHHRRLRHLGRKAAHRGQTVDARRVQIDQHQAGCAVLARPEPGGLGQRVGDLAMLVQPANAGRQPVAGQAGRCHEQEGARHRGNDRLRQGAWFTRPSGLQRSV